jgi:hypothetical protein
MLRGPQTAGELRINSERWYRFADISSVEGFLQELQDRAAEKGGPLVVKLARAAGMREQRWAHLLCGPVSLDAADTKERPSTDSPDAQSRIEALESEVAALRDTVQEICRQLGMSPPGHLQ